jgi:hypothetical protein
LAPGYKNQLTATLRGNRGVIARVEPVQGGEKKLGFRLSDHFRRHVGGVLQTGHETTWGRLNESQLCLNLQGENGTKFHLKTIDEISSKKTLTMN